MKFNFFSGNVLAQAIIILVITLFARAPVNAQQRAYSFIVTHKFDTIAVEQVNFFQGFVQSDLFLNKMSRQSSQYFVNESSKIHYVAIQSADFSGKFAIDTVFLSTFPSAHPKKRDLETVYFERSIFALQEIIKAGIKKAQKKTAVAFYARATGKNDTAIVTRKKRHVFELDIHNIKFIVHTSDLVGNVSRGNIPALNIKFTRTAIVPNPQLENPSASNSSSYIAREIHFKSANSDTLYGTLNLSVSNSPSPAYILITGLSQTNRNGGKPPQAPLYQIAHALGENGISSLRMDDRGTGHSTGKWAGSTMFDEANDISNAIDWLKRQPGIDSTRIGLIGWSEGAVIAPMLAAKRKDISSIILMAAMGTNGTDLARYQISASLEGQLPAGSKRDSVVAAEILSAKAESPKMRSLIDYSTLPNASVIKIPTLMLHGTSDKHVSLDQAKIFYNALRASGNKMAKFKIYKDINHIWLPDTRGQADYWPFLQSFTIPSEILQDLARWAAKINKLY